VGGHSEGRPGRVFGRIGCEAATSAHAVSATMVATYGSCAAGSQPVAGMRSWVPSIAVGLHAAALKCRHVGMLQQGFSSSIVVSVAAPSWRVPCGGAKRAQGPVVDWACGHSHSWKGSRGIWAFCRRCPRIYLCCCIMLQKYLFLSPSCAGCPCSATLPELCARA
jgi:hypothetical protein